MRRKSSRLLYKIFGFHRVSMSRRCFPFKDVSENKTKYQLWVFGGYSASKNETLDTVEYFDLENPYGEFKMYGNDERR